MPNVNGVEVGHLGLPPFAQTKSGPCIVAGTAPGYINEFYEARKAAGTTAEVLGVNKFGLIHEVHCQHWVTVHPEDYFPKRAFPTPTHSDKPGEQVDNIWPIATAGGSSALLATMIALVMGFEKVILAGVHLINAYASMQDRWIHFDSVLRGRVCSVSPKGTFIRDRFGGV